MKYSYATFMVYALMTWIALAHLYAFLIIRHLFNILYAMIIIILILFVIQNPNISVMILPIGVIIFIQSLLTNPNSLSTVKRLNSRAIILFDVNQSNEEINPFQKGLFVPEYKSRSRKLYSILVAAFIWVTIIISIYFLR